MDPLTNRLTLGSYDAAGAYENDGGANWYIHDSAGLIRERVTPSRAEAYLYTADDERIGTDTGDTVQFTIRGFDGKVLSEYEQPTTWSSALWVQDYVYRDGELIAAEREHAEGGIRHFHLDHLGTPRLITNEWAQKMAADDYLPFGRELTSWRQEMTDFDVDRPEHHHFTGHERDFGNNIYMEHENYLDYMHARYYDPRGGRFLEVDPVLGTPGRAMTWNRYSYVLDNPTSLVDPFGLADRHAGEMMQAGDKCRDGKAVDGWCTGYTIVVKAATPSRLSGVGRAAAFFFDWVLEKGATVRMYGSKDVEAAELSRSRGAQQMRDEYVRDGCVDSIFNPTKPGGMSGTYGTFAAYIETARDGNWIGNNATQAQVGGFIYGYQNIGDGQVMYSAYNQASMYSLFLHIPGMPHKPRGGKFPFMGNINQYFRWTEANPPGCP